MSIVKRGGDFMKQHVICGSGGFAREVLQIVEALQGEFNYIKEVRIDFLGFLDSNPENYGKDIHGHKVLGGIDWLAENENVHVNVAIGNPASKRKVIDEIRNKIKNPKF